MSTLYKCHTNEEFNKSFANLNKYERCKSEISTLKHKNSYV